MSIARNAFAHLPHHLRGRPLADIGCGRGRLLLVALDAGFSPVVGVEVDPSQAEAARRAVHGRARVDTADASTWALPDDVQVVALFNPFGSATMTDVLGQVRASLARRPRPLAIVYVNPVLVPMVEAAGFDLGWIAEDAAVLTATTVAPGRR